MLQINCPWCGPREETEFSYGGEAHLSRPDNAVSDKQWTEYLFLRTNTKGPFRERWNHANGCRRWFNAIRDTRSNQFLGVYKPGETPPEVKESSL